MTLRLRSISPGLVVALLAPAAGAQDVGASGSAELSAGGQSSEGAVEGDSAAPTLAPEGGLFELGAFLGVWWISGRHGFAAAGEPLHPIKNPVGELGLRAAYFPVSFLGIEAEGAIAPAAKADDERVILWAGRGHAILQLPFSRVTPFILGGGGRIGVRSDVLGNDSDPSYHYGGGVKVAVTRLASLRIDGRDNVTDEGPGYDTQYGVAHHPEVQLGFTLTLGRSEKKAPPPPPRDRDGDGFVDPEDKCPDVPGIEPDGCPDRDPDRDGILDPRDKCPDEPGIEPDGCPDKDPDKDGIPNPDDQCPTEPGVPPDGCPDNDPDKDGIPNPDDQCPTEPETKNGFKDADGCPDELPEEVKKFTGVIQGIEFDVNKATIRARSFSVLDQTVEVLTEYPDLRIMITGHTDSDGTRDHNMELSAERAESVKAYLVKRGVSEDRVETHGAGPDEPIADNKTKAGKQKNRRIEFRILH